MGLDRVISRSSDRLMRPSHIQSGDMRLRQPRVRLALGLRFSPMRLWFMSHVVSPLNLELFAKVVCLLNGVIFIDVLLSCM